MKLDGERGVCMHRNDLPFLRKVSSTCCSRFPDSYVRTEEMEFLHLKMR